MGGMGTEHGGGKGQIQDQGIVLGGPRSCVGDEDVRGLEASQTRLQ